MTTEMNDPATIAWTNDARGRLEATDPETGTRYRLEGSPYRDGENVQLAVYIAGATRSYDRTVFPNAEAAQEHTIRRMQHEREEVKLGRRTGALSNRTPWGRSRVCTRYAEGISLYSTSETDGFYLTPERNSAVPASLRLADGWYLEDMDGPRVVLAFPEAFTSIELEDAQKLAQELFPDAYDAYLAETASSPTP